MSQHFDVAVIGMQRAGIIAAALLAKRGQRVLLIDHGEHSTNYTRLGLKLPLVPELLPALDRSPQVNRVLDELGVGPELRSGRIALEPAFQAIMPHHRLDIRGAPDAILQELKLEFPQVVAGVAHFFERLFALDQEISEFLASSPPLPPSGWRQRWQAKSFLARVSHLDVPFESHQLLEGIPEDHPIRDLLLGPLAFFGHLAAETPSTFHAVRLLARYFDGCVAYPDRLGGLESMLIRIAQNTGVETKRGALVQRIVLDGRRLRTLEIAGERVPWSADYFIANTFSPFHEILPPNKHQARLAMEHQRTRPVGCLFVLNIVVEREVIPMGMGEALFLLNGRRQSRGDIPPDPPLFVRRSPAQRGKMRTQKNTQTIEDTTRDVLSIACQYRPPRSFIQPNGKLISND
ncbi:MAG: hypothetical protein R3C68_12505 [Myxococcota bacterium]